MGKIADKKIALQSKGVRISWELEEKLAKDFTGAVSDYMSFFMDGVPVGILNGFFTDVSPFEIRQHGEGYAIFIDERHFHDITFLERPLFFDKTTTRGSRMDRLCKMVAPGFPIIYMNRGCIYWGPKQCKFCVVGHIDTDLKKNPEDVAEAVREGVDEGAIKTHVALTSGAMEKDHGLKLLGETVSAIKRVTDIPVSVNPEPPRDLNHLEWIAEADSVYFNLEVFDERMRRKYIPGKSEFKISYFDRLFEECRRIFEENQVASVILAGLEEDSSYLKGIEYLASKDVIPVPVPFYPTFHSKIDSRSPPEAERMKRLYLECSDIIAKYSLDPFKTRAGFMKGGAIFALKEVIQEI